MQVDRLKAVERMMTEVFALLEFLEGSRAALLPFAKLGNSSGDPTLLTASDYRLANAVYHELSELLEVVADPDVPLPDA